MKPIVMDIETSGLDKVKCGIWQIGAIDLNDNEEFLREGKSFKCNWKNRRRLKKSK